MRLFIARHGEASFDAPSDRDRSLTPNGHEVTKGVLERNVEELRKIDIIWSSDLRRAQETAAIYSDELKVAVDIKRFLTPDGDPKRIIKEINALDNETQLLIVSHQPLVGEFVSLLCEGHVYKAHPYNTSEIVVIECEIPEPGLGRQIGNFLP